MTLPGRVADAFAALGIAEREQAAARVGIACSGGADSVALVHLAASLFRTVVVLHVDHGLREGSDEDAAFVTSFATRLGLDFVSERLDLDAGAGSVEAIARTARYAALERMARASGLRCVATAHTLDDQSETVLMRAMRGGSLGAIAPARGIFVRPLLAVRRSELRAWLVAHDITWRDDPTNDDLRHERNWIRHVLLPQLRSRRAGVDLALARVATNTRTDDVALDAVANDIMACAAVDDVGVFIGATDLDVVPVAVGIRVVRSALRRLGIEGSSDDVRAILRLRSGKVGIGVVDVWRLPAGLAFVAGPVPVPPPLALPRAGVLSDPVRGLRVRVGSADASPWRWRAILEGGPDGLTIRSRRPGDRIRVRGGSRKVQDVLVDAKVPRPLRDLVGIVARGPDALAVVGRATGADGAGTVVDVDPSGESWARELLWTSG